MEVGMIFEVSNPITDLFHNETLTSSSEVLDSFWISNSSSASFHGKNNNSSTMKPVFAQSEKGDEDFEKGRHQPEKKRRLAADQVEFLERSFEVENKLEPERKVQLAKELNLQPRQVAIWFQNRRARYKTKQLEKDYDFLNSNYDKLKLDFDCLQKDNDKLKHEIQMLTQKLHEREKGKQDSTPCEFPTKDLESNAEMPNPIPISAQNGTNLPKMSMCKQEDANSVSAKSEIIDSNSTDGHHSSFLEPTDSSNVFENQSDFSQDEDDNLSMNVLRFPKTEYGSYIDPNEGCFGYPVEDQCLWLWP